MPNPARNGHPRKEFLANRRTSGKGCRAINGESDEEEGELCEVREIHKPAQESYAASKSENSLEALLGRHLSSEHPLPISPTPICTVITPNFIKTVYSATDETHMRQTIPAEWNPKSQYQPDMRRIALPMPRLNPLMPRAPGDSGLLFCTNVDFTLDGPWSLFADTLTQGRAEWSYLGEYKSKVVGQMTSEEFNSMSSEMRRAWARYYSSVISDEARARLSSRKHEFIANGDVSEKDEAEAEGEDVIRNGKVQRIDHQIILDAFESGEEAIPIHILQTRCVGYDHFFANDMKLKYPSYEADFNAQKKAAKAARASKRRFQARSRKRALGDVQGVEVE
ncbi:hypothetical protein BKA70DRAFT_745303 [Coprinopsis sp. MPI-PUGE-AT-0042]|nr:hypothetical protein BKA70DRAFT_745303 [Coprinopsis sp. MPI-PUGE-AT-0042]